MRKTPVVFKAGMWIRHRPWLLKEERAVIVSVDGHTAMIHREHQTAPESIDREYLALAWRVMRPSYRNRRESRREWAGEPPMPEWVVPGGRYLQPFASPVYEIIEVRGMWMLSRDVVTGALLFKRASQLSNLRPVPTRFQRVL